MQNILFLLSLLCGPYFASQCAHITFTLTFGSLHWYSVLHPLIWRSFVSGSGFCSWPFIKLNTSHSATCSCSFSLFSTCDDLGVSAIDSSESYHTLSPSGLSRGDYFVNSEVAAPSSFLFGTQSCILGSIVSNWFLIFDFAPPLSFLPSLPSSPVSFVIFPL